ncbi:PmoA family protein [Tundrisphaera sp. TA3]|uniref:DUF6807 domain-containing protein n=1 Tax=Tundrisphaera sp. TA3 TaxID=3435775 RepID=UPI003EBD6521
MRKFSRSWMSARWALLVGFGLLAAGPAARSQTKVEVQGTDALGETPVIVPLSKELPVGPYQLAAPGAGGSPLPAQVFEQDGKRHLGFILDRLDAGAKQTYDLTPVPAENGHRGVTLTPEGRRVKIAAAGEPLTEYVPDGGSKPYLYPLLGPGGVKMTRSYPMDKVPGETTDHPHHESLWYAHGNVNGVDFWSILPNHGTIRETSRADLVQGPALGVLRTTDDWADSGGKLILTDERTVRIYATKGARVFDFDVVLKAPAPATFGDTKEGTFALRVATSMDVTAKKGGKIVTSEGLTDKAAWGKPASWVDYTGPIGGETFGIAILNHPDSFRAPTTWHVRDYGLFAANPFGWHDFGKKESGEFRLNPGESIVFGYRVVLHKGATDPAELGRAFQGYAHPPKVEIK